MPKAAAAMDDGGFVVAGTTTSWGGGGQDIWILRVDAAGDPALSPWVNESREVEPDVVTGDPLPPLTISGHADLGLVGVPTAFNAYETFAYSKVQE